LGLNLTRKTLNGILKYPWPRDEDDEDRKWNVYGADRDSLEWVRKGDEGSELRTIEAEVMDWADDVTYAVHDMDDFFRAGLVPLDRLCNGGDELDAFQRHLSSRHPERADALTSVAERVFHDLVLGFDAPYTGTDQERISLRGTGSRLITRYIDAPRIELSEGAPVFAVDSNLRDEVEILKQLAWFYVINRPSLGILQSGHRRVVRELYRAYETAALENEWRLFPPYYVARLRDTPAEDGRKRVVVDLIASMTEASAVEVYRRMAGMVGASISDPTGRLA
jgi:dGTPase